MQNGFGSCGASCRQNVLDLRHRNMEGFTLHGLHEQPETFHSRKHPHLRILPALARQQAALYLQMQ
jgi:hypothetical protein